MYLNDDLDILLKMVECEKTNHKQVVHKITLNSSFCFLNQCIFTRGMHLGVHAVPSNSAGNVCVFYLVVVSEIKISAIS